MKHALLVARRECECHHLAGRARPRAVVSGVRRAETATRQKLTCRLGRQRLDDCSPRDARGRQSVDAIELSRQPATIWSQSCPAQQPRAEGGGGESVFYSDIAETLRDSMPEAPVGQRQGTKGRPLAV
jgi:hypothetical protein